MLWPEHWHVSFESHKSRPWYLLRPAVSGNFLRWQDFAVPQTALYHPSVIPKPQFPVHFPFSFPFDSPVSLYDLYYRRGLDWHVAVDISASPSWVKAGLHDVGFKVSALSECTCEFPKIVVFFRGP